MLSIAGSWILRTACLLRWGAKGALRKSIFDRFYTVLGMAESRVGNSESSNDLCIILSHFGDNDSGMINFHQVL